MKLNGIGSFLPEVSKVMAFSTNKTRLSDDRQ